MPKISVVPSECFHEVSSWNNWIVAHFSLLFGIYGKKCHRSEEAEHITAAFNLSNMDGPWKGKIKPLPVMLSWHFDPNSGSSQLRGKCCTGERGHMSSCNFSQNFFALSEANNSSECNPCKYFGTMIWITKGFFFCFCSFSVTGHTLNSSIDSLHISVSLCFPKLANRQKGKNLSSSPVEAMASIFSLFNRLIGSQVSSGMWKTTWPTAAANLCKHDLAFLFCFLLIPQASGIPQLACAYGLHIQCVY